MLLDEVHGGFVVTAFGVLEGGESEFVAELGVGPGSQQERHTALLPVLRSINQGGGAVVGLHVKVDGRVLQQNDCDGAVAFFRSNHERGGTLGVFPVDVRASLQQLLHHLDFPFACGRAQ